MRSFDIIRSSVQPDVWKSLKTFTNARIALGRTGNAEPLKASLEFKLAHAHARDAVYSVLNKDVLLNDLKQFCLPVHCLHSQAGNRNTYLQRPDLGRSLNEDSAKLITPVAQENDIAIVMADGLSVQAINEHAMPLLHQLVPLLQAQQYHLAPITIVEQGRVAIADEIGFLLQSKLSLILIGERPGLSSPNSMGVYITYSPKPGNTDAERNCISNIHEHGLSYAIAKEQIAEIIKKTFQLKGSGIAFSKKEVLAQ